MALKLTKAHTDLLASIKTGATTHVANTAEVQALTKDGFIEVNPAMLDDNKNAAVRLTDKGTAAVPDNSTEATAPAEAAPAVSFFMATAPMELPSIKRGGGGGNRKPKYPLADIPEGVALFIAAPAGKKASALSKQFGSMIADFNKAHPDRYLTSRTLADGFEAGFRPADNPELYKGVSGVGIYRRPVSERPAPKETAKTE